MPRERPRAERCSTFSRPEDLSGGPLPPCFPWVTVEFKLPSTLDTFLPHCTPQSRPPVKSANFRPMTCSEGREREKSHFNLLNFIMLLLALALVHRPVHEYPRYLEGLAGLVRITGGVYGRKML